MAHSRVAVRVVAAGRVRWARWRRRWQRRRGTGLKASHWQRWWRRLAPHSSRPGRSRLRAAEAAERLRVEEQMAALALRMQGDALRMQNDALMLQQMQAQLGGSVATPAAPNPDAEETQCVVCMDAPKDRIVLPCMHLCACGPCAQRLLELDASCPVCRGPVERMAQVFS